VAAFPPKRVIALDEAHIVPVAEGISYKQAYSGDTSIGVAEKLRSGADAKTANSRKTCANNFLRNLGTF